MTSSTIGRLRLIGMIEGVSFLLLLGIGVPLKHLAGMPLAVKIFGWTHGVLFIAFVIALASAKEEHGWSLSETAVPFIAALLPFGPFVIDRRLKDREA
jgi:integral membrane protein